MTEVKRFYQFTAYFVFAPETIVREVRKKTEEKKKSIEKLKIHEIRTQVKDSG